MTTRRNSNINFSGENRTPEYAILLPSGGKVLCKAGASLGLSVIITRREANKKGIRYLTPLKWADSELYVYPNKEVRDAKGHYIGSYLGYEQDDLSGGMISTSDFGGTMHDIFIRNKNGKIFQINCFGEEEEVTVEKMVSYRLHWSTEWRIAGKSYPKEEDCLKTIRELAQYDIMALKAAIALKEM